MRILGLIAALAMVSACDRAQVERIDLNKTQSVVAKPIPSPFTGDAKWHVGPNERSIDFGNEGESPLMSLACSTPADSGPVLTVIRHAPAQPGAKALFAVIGNGMIARIYVNAAMKDGEWRWEGSYPAEATQLQVFTGQRNLQATLPGGGTLEIAGSPLPREFVNWCRSLKPGATPRQG